MDEYIKKLAKKYLLDVSCFDDTNINGDKIRIYKFTGNFLANFEELANKASKCGYEKTSCYGSGYLLKLYE